MKVKFIPILSCLALLALSACSEGTKSQQDSTAGDSTMTDTIVQTPTDSTPTPEMEGKVEEKVNPEEVLTASLGKKNLRYADESSGMTGTVTVNVTNNGNTEVSGNAYVVSYQELVEETKGGEFVDVTKKRTAPGKDVAPGETVTITLKAKAGCQDIKNPKIKNH